MTINEKSNFEEQLLDGATMELKSIPSTLNYAFLDTPRAKPVIDWTLTLFFPS